MLRYFAILLLLAGCMDNRLDGYEIEATDIPGEVAVNTTFTFHLTVTGEPERSTDHIGGHYWDAATDDPDEDFDDQAGACMHVPGGGPLPNAYDIECQFTEPGTYYLRGHARYDDDGETHNLWTDEHEIEATT